MMIRIRTLGAVAAALTCVLPGSSFSQTVPTDLGGLWEAKVRFGPETEGTLRLFRLADRWRADIAGLSAPAQWQSDEIAFALPDGQGRFLGRRRGTTISGHWFAPPTGSQGIRYATPVTLRPDGRDRWVGEVRPARDTFTFYMPVTARLGGGWAAWLRNPERNQGRFIPVSRLEVENDTVRLFGGRAGQPEALLASGRLSSDGRTLSVPLRGRTYDFSRSPNVAGSSFHPRGWPGERYRYAPPLQLDDGWPVGTLDDAGISQPDIEAFVQRLIDTPMDSVGSAQIHSLLIARRGRLVLEEYFHGHHRDQPHDTRSAAKSWTSALIGAAMQAGVPLREDTPVYATMQAEAPTDPRKRAMTLEHLLTMRAGFNCDDNNASAPGSEDRMQDQSGEPDWYRYTLNVPLVSAPGERLVYCSAEANLAAGMLQRVADEPLPELFQRLVAGPLSMGRYHLQLTPTGTAYGGGGHHFTPRDFMKLPQLMMNGGQWNGRQIVSREWARRSTAPLGELSAVQRYGYFWNSIEYPWRGRIVRAFFAGGNGGQLFMAVPELELVIAFTGGSYSDPAGLIPQRTHVPQHILPAVR